MLLRLIPATSRTSNRTSLGASCPSRCAAKTVEGAQTLVRTRPEHLVGDAAYDQLDAELAQRGVELIASHRRDRKRKTQDARPLRRYRRRWKVERLFAWLQNYRRIVVRYERHAENSLGMSHLACCLILLRRL